MKHIHMIGIGGSAMAPLAGMLRERGYRVTGSDAGVYPPASTLLESLAIPFASTFDAKHLTPAPDLIVVGNAISRGNVEVEEMLDRKLPHRSLPEILEEDFLPGKHSIVVTGTHGKTTTTAMLAWIFHVAGKHPNFLVGGVAENFGKSYGLGGGPEFILEGDEYDSAYWDKAAKFFHYQPDDLIITSLEFDHADIYADFDAYQLAFRRLVNLVPRRGRTVIWGDSAAGEALRKGKRLDRRKRGNRWRWHEFSGVLEKRALRRDSPVGHRPPQRAERARCFHHCAGPRHSPGIHSRSARNLPERKASDGCERRN